MNRAIDESGLIVFLMALLRNYYCVVWYLWQSKQKQTEPKVRPKPIQTQDSRIGQTKLKTLISILIWKIKITKSGFVKSKNMHFEGESFPS